jgi:hypothetical protein
MPDINNFDEMKKYFQERKYIDEEIINRLFVTVKNVQVFELLKLTFLDRIQDLFFVALHSRNTQALTIHEEIIEKFDK